VSETVCGLPAASSLTASVAVRVPPAVGANVTLIVHEPPAASVEPQVLLWPKSPGFAPVSEMLAMLSGAVPVLVKVALCAALVLPTRCEPKANEVGASEAPGALVPAALRRLTMFVVTRCATLLATLWAQLQNPVL
jgi:hypothetical protein